MKAGPALLASHDSRAFLPFISLYNFTFTRLSLFYFDLEHDGRRARPRVMRSRACVTREGATANSIGTMRGARGAPRPVSRLATASDGDGSQKQLRPQFELYKTSTTARPSHAGTPCKHRHVHTPAPSRNWSASRLTPPERNHRPPTPHRTPHTAHATRHTARPPTLCARALELRALRCRGRAQC